MLNPFKRNKIPSFDKPDKEIQELVKRVIQNDLGHIVSEVIAANMKPINGIVEQMQATQDVMVRQVNEDRKDIGTLKTSHVTIIQQQKTIIDNQNHSEERIVDIIHKEVKKIPLTTEKAVENMFEKKPFLYNIRSKFSLKHGK